MSINVDGSNKFSISDASDIGKLTRKIDSLIGPDKDRIKIDFGEFGNKYADKVGVRIGLGAIINAPTMGLGKGILDIVKFAIYGTAVSIFGFLFVPDAVDGVRKDDDILTKRFKCLYIGLKSFARFAYEAAISPVTVPSKVVMEFIRGMSDYNTTLTKDEEKELNDAMTEKFIKKDSETHTTQFNRILTTPITTEGNLFMKKELFFEPFDKNRITNHVQAVNYLKSLPEKKKQSEQEGKKVTIKELANEYINNHEASLFCLESKTYPVVEQTNSNLRIKLNSIVRSSDNDDEIMNLINKELNEYHEKMIEKMKETLTAESAEEKNDTKKEISDQKDTTKEEFKSELKLLVNSSTNKHRIEKKSSNEKEGLSTKINYFINIEYDNKNFDAIELKRLIKENKKYKYKNLHNEIEAKEEKDLKLYFEINDTLELREKGEINSDGAFKYAKELQSEIKNEKLKQLLDKRWDLNPFGQRLGETKDLVIKTFTGKNINNSSNPAYVKLKRLEVIKELQKDRNKDIKNDDGISKTIPKFKENWNIKWNNKLDEMMKNKSADEDFKDIIKSLKCDEDSQENENNYQYFELDKDVLNAVIDFQKEILKQKNYNLEDMSVESKVNDISLKYEVPNSWQGSISISNIIKKEIEFDKIKNHLTLTLENEEEIRLAEKENKISQDNKPIQETTSVVDDKAIEGNVTVIENTKEDKDSRKVIKSLEEKNQIDKAIEKLIKKDNETHTDLFIRIFNIKYEDTRAYLKSQLTNGKHKLRDNPFPYKNIVHHRNMLQDLLIGKRNNKPVIYEELTDIKEFINKNEEALFNLEGKVDIDFKSEFMSILNSGQDIETIKKEIKFSINNYHKKIIEKAKNKIQSADNKVPEEDTLDDDNYNYFKNIHEKLEIFKKNSKYYDYYSGEAKKLENILTDLFLLKKCVEKGRNGEIGALSYTDSLAKEIDKNILKLHKFNKYYDKHRLNFAEEEIKEIFKKILEEIKPKSTDHIQSFLFHKQRGQLDKFVDDVFKETSEVMENIKTELENKDIKPKRLKEIREQLYNFLGKKPLLNFEKNSDLYDRVQEKMKKRKHSIRDLEGLKGLFEDN